MGPKNVDLCFTRKKRLPKSVECVYAATKKCPGVVYSEAVCLLQVTTYKHDIPRFRVLAMLFLEGLQWILKGLIIAVRAGK